MRLKTLLATACVLLGAHFFMELRRDQIAAKPQADNSSVLPAARMFKLDDFVQVHVLCTSNFSMDELNIALPSSDECTTQEQLDYKITARIVELLPNGKLALQARKSMNIDGEISETTLTGIVASVDVQANDIVLSKHIAELQIIRRTTPKQSHIEPWYWLLAAMNF